MNRALIVVSSLAAAALAGGCGTEKCNLGRPCLPAALRCTVEDASTGAAIAGVTFTGPTVGSAVCQDSPPQDGGSAPCGDWRVDVNGANAPVTISAPGYVAQTLTVTTSSGETGACACPSTQVQRDVRLTKS